MYAQMTNAIILTHKIIEKDWCICLQRNFPIKNMNNEAFHITWQLESLAKYTRLEKSKPQQVAL